MSGNAKIEEREGYPAFNKHEEIKMDQNDLNNRFTYHEPVSGQDSKYRKLRKQALDLADTLNSYCPDSRELSLAITKLEEVVFWANAAIARNSG